MKPYTSEDIFAYAKWLTQECQASGLHAEQHDAEVLLRGTNSRLDERVTCRPDARGELRRHWSWGAPIGRLKDPSRPLAVDDVTELVRSITNVVAVPPRGAK